MKSALASLCALLLALAPAAKASITTTGAGKVPAAVVGYSGPGDIVASALGWYGLRAYSAANADGTHTAVELTRASDSHTCKVLLTTAGGLGNTSSCSTGGENGTAVATWCTSTTCTIDAWTDQSGNGRDMLQATVANQATLTFSCLGSLPCATFGGSAYYAATATSLAQPMFIAVVGERTGNFTGAQAIMADNGNNANVQFSGATNSVAVFAGGTVSATASDSAFHVLQFVANNASSAVTVDSTTNTGTAGSLTWGSIWVISSIDAFSPSAPATGKFTEFGVWSAGSTSSTLCHNAFVYWGTSTSC